MIDPKLRFSSPSARRASQESDLFAPLVFEGGPFVFVSIRVHWWFNFLKNDRSFFLVGFDTSYGAGVRPSNPSESKAGRSVRCARYGSLPVMSFRVPGSLCYILLRLHTG